MSTPAASGGTNTAPTPETGGALSITGIGEAISAMRRLPDALEAIVDSLPAAHLGARPAPDEWSAAEILAHLVTVEAVLTARVESMLASPGGRSLAVDPPAASPSAGRGLVARWRDARAGTLDRLARLTADELGRGAELRRWGYVTVEQQVCEWAYHDLEHLRQLLAVGEALLYPAIGGYTALYAPPFPVGPVEQGAERR